MCYRWQVQVHSWRIIDAEGEREGTNSRML